MWVRVPLGASDAVAFWPNELQNEADVGQEAKFEAAWRAWSTFHSITGFQREASLALELTAELPADAVLSRWLAEPIGALLVPVNLLQRTSNGKLELPPRHQAFLFSVLRNGMFVLLSCKI